MGGRGLYGKILAVGMAIANTYGFLLLFVGIYVRFKIGSLLAASIGDINSVVTLKSAISPGGQNICPLGTITDDVDLGFWPKLLGALVMGSGIFTIVFATLGIYAGVNHNKLLLLMTIVILVVTAFIIIAIISIVSDLDSAFHKDSKFDLVEILNTDFHVETKNSAFTFAMNSIMLWFECCGITGAKDFRNLTFVEIKAGVQLEPIQFKVAAACCSRSLFNNAEGPDKNYYNILQCAKKGYEDMSVVNGKGCYNTLFQTFQSLASALLAVILIWNVLMLVLAILTTMEIKPEGGELRPTASKEAIAEKRAAEKEKEEEIAAQAALKKFVPYAKVSSFNHPDINRIKSTEIW